MTDTDQPANPFNSSKVYALRCLETDQIYVGSTVQDLAMRHKQHQIAYKSHTKGGRYSYCSSFEIVKYLSCEIELLEDVNCESRQELETFEKYHIESNNTVNLNTPGRSPDEKKAVKKIHNERTNAQRPTEQCECPCSGFYTYSNHCAHLRTAKHQSYEQKKNEIADLENEILQAIERLALLKS